MACSGLLVLTPLLPSLPPPQVPDVHVWYGPDTYMGRNLAQLFQSLANLRWGGQGRGPSAKRRNAGGTAGGILHPCTWQCSAPLPTSACPLSACPHSDEEVRELHPAHTQASIHALLPRLRYFEQGTCIVHHLFGGEVCELVK